MPGRNVRWPRTTASSINSNTRLTSLLLAATHSTDVSPSGLADDLPVESLDSHTQVPQGGAQKLRPPGLMRLSI
eukprot:3103488-Alexandrium_andersonii.AAC.1